MFIAPRLTKVVQLHIFRNLAAAQLGNVPLILGIDGSPGEGKTFSVIEIVKQAALAPFLISGGQLESPHSGRPAELVRESYEDAGRALTHERNRGAVVIINDIDAGVGDWGDLVQYTVNRQSVFSELMHLCDFPNDVDGRHTPRVPIIVTGNDFTKLYEPLIRSGRFRHFSWLPTSIEKIQIIAHILPPDLANEAARLIEEFPDKPISFFNDLLEFSKEETVWMAIQQVGFAQALDHAGVFPVIETSLF